MSKKWDVKLTTRQEHSLWSDDLNVFITEWGNGEGVDIYMDTPKKHSPTAMKLRDVQVSLSWDQLEVLKKVIESVWLRYTGGENG